MLPDRHQTTYSDPIVDETPKRANLCQRQTDGGWEWVDVRAAGGPFGVMETHLVFTGSSTTANVDQVG